MSAPPRTSLYASRRAAGLCARCGVRRTLRSTCVICYEKLGYTAEREDDEEGGDFLLAVRVSFKRLFPSIRERAGRLCTERARAARAALVRVPPPPRGEIYLW